MLNPKFEIIREIIKDIGNKKTDVYIGIKPKNRTNVYNIHICFNYYTTAF